MKNKVIIAGTRYFDDYHLLKKEVDAFIKDLPDVEIMSGRCDRGTLTFVTDDGIKVYGADGLGERYAKDNGLKVHAFPAEWEKYGGKKAAYIRNQEMVNRSTHIITFWDEISSGTQMVMRLAGKKRLIGVCILIKQSKHESNISI